MVIPEGRVRNAAENVR